MCIIEAMDTSSKHTKTDCCLRKTMKPGSKLRWKLLRISPENTEALQQCGATIRKYLHRETRRVQLAKLATKVLGDLGRKEKKESRPAAACMNRQPAGAMAPQNTTQYLMGNVYEDMTTNIQTVPVSHDLYSESLSPRSVYAALDLDSDYEGCLDFQQRDFEEVFNQCWW